MPSASAEDTFVFFYGIDCKTMKIVNIHLSTFLHLDIHINDTCFKYDDDTIKTSHFTPFFQQILHAIYDTYTSHTASHESNEFLFYE